MDKRASDLSRIADTAEEAGFPGVLKAVLTKEMAVAADVLEAFPLLKQTWGMGQVEAIQNLGMKLAKSKSMRCVSAAVAIVSAILQRCGQTISQGLTSKVQVDSAAEACRKLEALVAVLSYYTCSQSALPGRLLVSRRNGLLALALASVLSCSGRQPVSLKVGSWLGSKSAKGGRMGDANMHRLLSR